LDALCLDPNAEVFLGERVDLLLGNNVGCSPACSVVFLHVASIPGGVKAVSAYFVCRTPSFSLFLEAQFRTPIPGRWVAVARF